MTQYIVSSGVQSGISLNDGDTMSVFSTGTASEITIFGGGQEIVYDGGKSKSSVVSGTKVTSAGITTVTHGLETVSAQGTSYDTKVKGLGHEVVLSGGAALNTSVEGTLYVSSGGSATSTTIFAGGNEIVSSGGKETYTVINHGRETVLKGGTSKAAEIAKGGTQYDSGSSLDAYVSGGRQDIDGGTSISSLVTYDGEQSIVGGRSVSTTLGNNIGAGYQGLTGGVASLTIISNRLSMQEVFSGGISVGTKIESGQEEVDGGKASGTIVDSEGTLYAVSGGQVIGTHILNGIEIVSSGGSTRNTYIDSGTLKLAAGGSANGGITFAGSGGTLIVHEQHMPSAVISGFEVGDSIDLSYVPYSTSDSVSVKSPGIVTISAGGKDYNLHIAGATVGETDFSFGSGSVLTRDGATQPSFLRPAVSAAAVTNGLEEKVVLTSPAGVAASAIVGPVTSAIVGQAWRPITALTVHQEHLAQLFSSRSI